MYSWGVSPSSTSRVVVANVLIVLVLIGGAGPIAAVDASDDCSPTMLALVDNRDLGDLGDSATVLHDYGGASLVRLCGSLPTAAGNRIHPLAGDDAVGFRSWHAGRDGWAQPASDVAGVVVLRLIGPIDPDWREQLTAAGVDILAPADGHALVVAGEAAALERAATITTSEGLGVVTGLMALPLEARVERSLRAAVRGDSSGPLPQLVPESYRRRPLPADVKAVLGDGTIRLGPGELGALLRQHPQIAYVEPKLELELHANLAARAGLLDVEPVWLELGVNGAGITVAHNDGGVDLEHPDLAGVVAASVGRMAYADTAHGTHTAGAIVGRGLAQSPANQSTCGDVTEPLSTVRGMAWGATLVTNNLFEEGLAGVPEMMLWGVDHGAQVSSNSWGQVSGSEPVVGYTQAAADADAAARDADPTTPGAQPMTIFFSVGNLGPGPGTVTAPSTAKNVVSVGASQNDRCGAWVPARQDGPDPTQVVSSSGRGPSQGRIKPDLVAPGSDVLSLESGDPYAVQSWDQPWTGPWLALNTGTSQACALAAGAGAVLHEALWRDRGLRPSPALVKAGLITGAAGTDVDAVADQGWGRLDLAATVIGPASGEVTWLDQDETAALPTGGAWSTPVVVRSSSAPLLVTVAWTDVPGEADADHPLVNDLDLTVTGPNGTIYRGNVLDGAWSRPDPGAVRDEVNNLEVVRVPDPTVGDWSVDVVAVEVAENPAGLSGQDFAVVVSGDAGTCAAAPPAPLDVTAVPAGDNRIRVSWSAVAGAQRTQVLRSRTTGGRPYVPVAEVEAPEVSWVDTDVEGGLGYFYVVRAFDDCWSELSSEASAAATGSCDLPPRFAGLTRVSDGDGTTCVLRLEWSPAVSECGRSVVYDVYRGTAAGFEPTPANRVANGIVATDWNDRGLVDDRPYHYVVRARDQGVGVDDGNRIVGTATPTGPDDVFLADGAENGDAGWHRASGSNADAGTDPWQITVDDAWEETHAWFAGAEDRVKDQVLATAEPIAIPLGASAILEFRHRYRLDRGHDGGRLEVSTNGGLDWNDILASDGQTIAADPGRWVEGGYTDTIGDPANPLYRADGWTGDSRGWLRTAVDMAAFAGREVLLRWRLGCDDKPGIADGGWWLDGIRLVELHSCQSCLGPPAPTGLTAEPTGLGVELRWQVVAGAQTYHVARSAGAGGPHRPLATVSAPIVEWLDTTASGGSTYGWVVSADDGCRSEPSTEAVAVAAGPCLAPPRFWGLDSVSDPRDDRCALDLQWRSAVPGCAGAEVRYRVYRSSTVGFEPSPATLLADGQAGPRYRDTTVADGETMFYRVRAVDGTSLTEDDNPVERGGRTTGPDQLLFADSVEGAVDEWRTGPGSGQDSGTDPWEVTGDVSHTGMHAWYCADESAIKDQVLELERDFRIDDPTMVLSFHHVFDHEIFWDGGRLEYSTDSGVSWHDILDGDGVTVAANPDRFLLGGYNGTLSFGTGNPLAGEWAWTGFVTGWLETVVDLGDMVGLDVRFRWRLGCDVTEAGTGWWLDDVELWLTRSCTTVTLPPPRDGVGRRP